MGAPADHLANERTFLAWIRTGIAVMVFGFVVVKFNLFIRQVSFFLDAGALLPAHGYYSVVGVVLIGLGIVITILAFFKYKRIERQLSNNSYRPDFTLSLLLTGAILLAATLLVVYLVSNVFV